MKRKSYAGFAAKTLRGTAAAATAIVGTTVIAIAWFAYRPIVSLVVLALGFGIAYLFRQWRIKRQQARGQFIPATHGKA